MEEPRRTFRNYEDESGERYLIIGGQDHKTGKCDPSVVKCWYGEEIDVDHLTVEEIKEKYNI